MDIHSPNFTFSANLINAISFLKFGLEYSGCGITLCIGMSTGGGAQPNPFSQSSSVSMLCSPSLTDFLENKMFQIC